MTALIWAAAFSCAALGVALLQPYLRFGGAVSRLETLIAPKVSQDSVATRNTIIRRVAGSIAAHRHRVRFSEDFRVFIDRVRATLLGGASLSVAMMRGVDAAPSSIGVAFAPVLSRMTNGDSLENSLLVLYENNRSQEVALFSAAIATNIRFGGSLAAALGNLSETLRRRELLRREQSAATSQIRTSAIILAALPVIIGILSVVGNPEYAAWFIEHRAGHWMFGYAAASQVAGILVMRRMARLS